MKRNEPRQSRAAPVDMSSEAIDQRLRDVSQLRKLGLLIQEARPLGKWSDLQMSSDASSPTRTSQLGFPYLLQ